MRFSLPLAGFIVLMSGMPSPACSIPVFRYALERWKPSPYEFVVYHRGPLSENERKNVKKLEDLLRSSNAEVTAVDLDDNREPQLKAVWKQHGGNAKLPWVIARFPESDLKTPLAWSGPLDPDRVTPLLDSPLRRAIVSNLFSGESAVFVLLESGDAAADAEALKLLNSELPKLEKKIELPKPTSEGPQLRSEIPLRVGLSVITLSRTNKQEAVTIDLLLKCEDDLEKAKGPIVFVVFGRGRVLTALHGKDLKASELESVSRFLCGACSCQVKELNPGMDFLFSCRWDAFLDIELSPRPRVVGASEKR